MSAVEPEQNDATAVAAEMIMARGHLQHLKQWRARVEELPALEAVLGTREALDKAIRSMRSQVAELEASFRALIPSDQE